MVHLFNWQNFLITKGKHKLEYFIINIYTSTLLFLDGICKSSDCIKSGNKLSFHLLVYS